MYIFAKKNIQSESVWKKLFIKDFFVLFYNLLFLGGEGENFTRVERNISNSKKEIEWQMNLQLKGTK